MYEASVPALLPLLLWILMVQVSEQAPPLSSEE
jgi:hypothetical protein